MRKALGLLAWTSLAASGLWATLPGGTTRPVSADQPTSTTPVADRGSSLSRINPFSRSRNKSATKPENEVSYREQAEKLLKDAQALALRGDLAGARQLAERAQSFPVEWGPKDRSPEKFLAQLDASMKYRAPETAIAAKPSVKPSTSTAGVTRQALATSTPASAANKPTAREALGLDDAIAQAPSAESARKPIQQVNNEESTGDIPEFAEETTEETIPQVPASTAKRSAGSSPAERMSAAKSLLQQARRDLAKGDLAAARDKAEQASEIDVAYSVFDERPEQLLAEIDRRTNNVGEGAPRTQSLAQNSKKTATTKPAAAALLDEPVFDDDEPLPAKKPVAVTTKKLAASPFAEESPFEEDVAEAKQPAATAELAPANNDKQLAQQLLKQAQSAASQGDLEQARSLALEAKELDVTYSLFDIRPEQVLAQVDRATNNLTIAKGSARAKAAAKELQDAAAPLAKPSNIREPAFDLDEQPTVGTSLADNAKTAADSLKNSATDAIRRQATPSKSLEEEIAEETELGAARIAAASKAASKAKETEDQATAKVRQQAMTALQQARQELQAGRIEAARQKALAAQKLNATFGLWDDRPEALLDEIERLAEVQKPAAPSKKLESNDSKARAMALLKQARTDLNAGRVSEAQEKAQQAAEMNVAFDVFDDRPETVMAAIQRATRNTAAAPKSLDPESNLSATPSAQVAKQTPSKSVTEPKTPASNPATLNSQIEPISAPAAEDDTEPTNVAVIHPEGPSVEQLFREGQIHLKSGNKAAAYQAFLQAYQSGQKLDGRRSQQLQEYLRELSPRRKPIQLTSGQTGSLADEGTTANDAEPGTLNPQRPIDIAAERQKVQVDRLRSEVLNAIFRADRLREKDPAKAIEILDQAMANVESAPLEKPVTASLATTLRKTRAEIESFQKQMEPNLAQSKRNDEVKQSIKRTSDTKVRIEREFANLVKEFNELMDQKRYAEAEVIAKQAQVLAPDNPVSETLILKSVLARRIDSNDKLKDSKERGFWAALDSVEHSAIPFDDRLAIEFGKDWDEITKRRRGKYGTDVRIRTPEEQRIESSLTRPITLNFENAPLKQVITHIATLADVNVVLDESGLADESLTVSTPVSIDVQGIQLKNALVLLLEPLNMGYTIKNEVLKITSEQRLQGQAVLVTYSVADLVVPVQPGQPNLNVFGNTPTMASTVGGQMSVPSTGGLQGGQFQVGNTSGFSPWAANSQSQWQTTPNGNGHDFRALIDLITSTCEPNSWEEVAGNGHIKGNETTLSLVIRQTQKVHDEIRDLLEQLRRLQDLQVTIEVRFVSVSDNFFERIGVDFDFDLQDSLGGPNLYSGQTTTGQQGQQGGQQGGQQAQSGGLIPIPPFGTLLPSQTQQQGQQQQGQQQQGQQGQQGQQQGATGTNFFTPGPQRQLTDRDNYGKGGQVVGLGSSNSFTNDMDIAFRQGSFGIGVPDFGRFDANAGVNIGFAILSDIETFFFINAAQGDRRNNIMSAPKVTLFNGQTGTVFDGTLRPFVTALIPVVGAFAVGYQPIIQQVNEGVTMSVTAVISADRRYVRLAVTPNFSVIREVQSFTFVSAGSQGQRGGQQGGQGGGGLGGGGGGGGGAQQGFGGIGGGAGMEYGGVYNHGLFGHAMGDRTDVAMAAQTGFGGIGGGVGGGGGGFGGGGGGGQGGGQQGGGQQGFQAAGAGEVTVQQPIIAQTTVLTTVAVPDGGTVLLGGVKRLSESRNMAGVPILNKIPYLSRLFKNTGVGRETQSLMLMVTPRIVILEEEETLLGIPQ